MMILEARVGLVGLILLSWLALACQSKKHSRPVIGAAQDNEGKEANSDTGDVSSGEALYSRYCELCHGAGAEGYAADNANQLRNSTFLATASTPFLWLGIERGRPGTPMAGFGDVVGGPLDGEAIKKIIAYLRSLATTEGLVLEDVVVEGDPELGREIYTKTCSGCHGTAGEGGTATSLGNPYFLATASDGFIRYAIQHGRPGTEMKAYGDDLSPAEVDGLTRYIRSWARTVEDGSSLGESLPGVDEMVINPDGADAAFENLRDGRYVSVDVVAAALDQGARMVLLDARPTSDWFKAHIPGAFPAPFYDGISKIAGTLPRDGTWIVAYCACPHAASGKIIDALRGAGFSNTAILDEGVLIWSQRGHPMTIGLSE